MEVSSNPTITDNSSYTIRDRTNGPIGQFNSYHGHMTSSANPIRNDHFAFNGQNEKSAHRGFARSEASFDGTMADIESTEVTIDLPKFNAEVKCIIRASILKFRQQMAKEIAHHGHMILSACKDHFLNNGQNEKSVHERVPVPKRESVVFKESNIGGQYYDLMTSIEDTTADDAMADVEDTKMKIEETVAKIKPFGKGKNLSSFILLLTDGNYGQKDSPATARNHDPIRYVMHEILHCEWLLGAHDLKMKSKWLVKKFIVTLLT